MHKIFVFGLMILVIEAYGQNEVLFDTQFRPNKSYKSFLTTLSTTEIDFEGPDEMIEKIRANGVKLPMVISGSNEMTTVTTTGTMTNDHSFPARIVYGNVINKQNVNGVQSENEGSISNLIIEGYYLSKNKLRIDTMISETMDPGTKELIKATLENVQQLIHFPETPLKVGDTFDQKIPLSIPIAGLAPVDVVITTIYRLQDISKGIAKFELKQTVILGIQSEQANVTASGEGTGFSEFDIANSMTTGYYSDLTLTMKISTQGLTVKADINAKTKQSVTIE